MNPLRIEAKRDTPEIILDSDTNVFTIKGTSHPENIREVYVPVFVWLDEYLEELKGQENQKIIFEFYYKYINSASLRYLFDLLRKMVEFKDNGIDVSIIWSYADDDEDMKEAGEELSLLKGIHLSFDYVAVPV